MALRGIDKLREEGLFKLKKTLVTGRCAVARCCNDSKARQLLCHKHFQQRWRSRAKKENTYALLKSHAKARGIPFDLSREYFSGLADALAMFDHQAETRGEIPSLDRIDPTLGYVRGNVRVISHSENVVKGNRERYLPEHIQSVLARKRAQAVKNFEDLERRMNGGFDPEDPF